MEEFILILEKLKQIKLFLQQLDLLFIFCLVAVLIFKCCAWNKCYKEKRKIKNLMPEEKFLLKEIYFNRTSGLSINKGNEFIKYIISRQKRTYALVNAFLAHSHHWDLSKQPEVEVQTNPREIEVSLIYHQPPNSGT